MGWGKKETPYLITILIAIAGWSISHIADRVLKSPVVEYRISTSKSGDTNVIKVSTLNLSSKVFVDLKFELQGRGVKPCNPPMEFDPPAWASSSAPHEGTDGVGFPISQLHPNWHVTICGLYRGDKRPVFVLRESGGRDQAIELRQPELATWVLKNEACLMIGLAVMAILGFIAWAFLARDTR